MKTSIIIPVNGHWDYTLMCLKSIERNTKDYEIIIIDNGSEPMVTYDDIDSLVGDKLIIRNKKNLGFPAGCNIGVKVAEGDLICLLNNDTVVTPDWLQHLKYFIETDQLDVVGPVTNYISGVQQISAPTYQDEQEMMDAAQAIYAQNAQQYRRLYRVVGFCMLMKQEVWNDVGGFDEVFGIGNFEDDDFCLRAIQKGYRLGYALDTFIHHFGSVSHDHDTYERLLERNAKIFQSMWTQEQITELIRKNGG